MAKKKIFISSVQTEFEQERKSLHEYICADPLLGKFFDPFLFELLPAIDQRVDAIYLKEVERSGIYLGIFGKEYGSESVDGVSPTENPLLAEPLYLAGYIERMGTGTSDMVRKSLAAGLAEPVFIQAEDFRSIVYRPVNMQDTSQVSEQVKEQVKEQVREQVKEQVKEILLTIIDEMSTQEIMLSLNLKGRRNFLHNYLQPALENAIIEMTQPESPNSPTQKYRLTLKGKELKELLRK